MQAGPIPITCADGACHGSGSIAAAIRFANNSSAAFAFATGPTTQAGVNRSVANSPSTSLFLRKPAGQCSAATPCSNALSNPNGHSGGSPWSTGANLAAFNAVSSWINGGLGPVPIELGELAGLTGRTPPSPRAPAGTTAGRLLADLFRRPR